MLKTVLVAICILAAAALSACVDPGDPLKGYVERSAKLEVTGGGLEGELAFAEGASPIRSRIYGLDTWEAIESAYLGIHTTERFQLELGRLGAPLGGLDPQARTVLLLRAKGFALVPGQAFLTLPADFRPGQRIDLVLRVEHAAPNFGDSTVSAVGSDREIP